MDHTHERMTLAFSNDEEMELIENLLGAANDGCRECQVRLFDEILDGPWLPVHILASSTYLAMRHSLEGPIPEETLKSRFAMPTRRIFRAYNVGSLVEAQHVCEGLTRAERFEVLEDAVDLIVGMVALGLLR